MSIDNELARDLERHDREAKPDEDLGEGRWRDNITGDILEWSGMDIQLPRGYIHVEGLFIWEIGTNPDEDLPSTFQIDEARELETDNPILQFTADEETEIRKQFMVRK